jgi:glycosyltransferase involved in cell wall biosynthesis
MENLLPKISIITPSYNQGEFLERTINSVLSQNYENLEYIIIDGGSIDNTIDILTKYNDRLSYWVSEPDQGQVSAINKGLMVASGEWVGWQNSDDIYYPNFLNSVASIILADKDVDLITSDINLIDKYDNVIRDVKYIKPSYNSMLAEGMLLANQSCLWRKSIHKSLGYINPNFDLAFDYEWFLRILKNHHKVVHIPQIFGALRYHSQTKTNLNQDQFLQEFKIILSDHRFIRSFSILYKIKRSLSYLMMGEYNYFLRGIKKHLNNLI